MSTERNGERDEALARLSEMLAASDPDRVAWLTGEISDSDSDLIRLFAQSAGQRAPVNLRLSPETPLAEAAAELFAEGISAAVLNARFAKPLDGDRILKLASRCGALVTVEEHSGSGGFGSAVLEALSAAGVVVASRCLGVPDWVIEHGDTEKIRCDLGLDAEGIARAVRDLVEGSAAEGC